MTTTDITVRGMTCEHCVRSVTEELREIDGVHEVTIDLVPGGASRVRIESAGELTDESVAAAVDEAGYELAG